MLFKLLDCIKLFSLFFFLYSLHFSWMLFRTSVSLVYFSLKRVFNSLSWLCHGTVNCTMYSVLTV